MSHSLPPAIIQATMTCNIQHRQPLLLVPAPAADLSQLDDVRKLDLSNPQQMALLHRYFSHNLAAVDLWLAFCVLPKETQQFPKRLSASAWHLAPCGLGFSGTNDNQQLMPLAVHQAQLGGLPQVSGTNGYMLDMMLRTARYSTLPYSQVGRGCSSAACCCMPGIACCQHASRRQCQSSLACRLPWLVEP
jgi:hypothetical protein